MIEYTIVALSLCVNVLCILNVIRLAQSYNEKEK
jgi:hypothetical protein